MIPTIDGPNFPASRGSDIPALRATTARISPVRRLRIARRSISGLRELRSLDLRFARSLANSPTRSRARSLCRDESRNYLRRYGGEDGSRRWRFLESSCYLRQCGSDKGSSGSKLGLGFERILGLGLGIGGLI